MSKLFTEWQPIADSIADVRSDSSSTDWMLCGYADGKVETLRLVGSGEGCVDELSKHLKADQAMFGLVRISERIDESDTIKFCFIKWVGTSMRPLSRAKLPTQVGDITAKFKPHHVDLYCSELNEITQEVVEGLVGKASMAKSAVLDNSKARAIMDDNDRKKKAVEEKKVTTGPSVASPIVNVSSSDDLSDDQKDLIQKLESFKVNGIITEEEFELKKKQIISERSSSTSSPTVAKKPPVSPRASTQSGTVVKGDAIGAMQRAKSKQINFPNQDDIANALKDVRNDQTPTDWALIGYSNLSQTKEMDIDLVGSGTGGIEELKSHLRDDNIYYGLVRLTDDIDTGMGIVSTIKFAFIHFIGNDLKPLVRARVTTHKSPVSEVFEPFHVETFASKGDELTQDALSQLVGAASMTKSNVLDNSRAKQISEENEAKRRQIEEKPMIVNKM